MLSRGSSSTGLRRCHGPDGPLAGMVDGHLAGKLVRLGMHTTRLISGVVGEEVGETGKGTHMVVGSSGGGRGPGVMGKSGQSIT